MKTIIDRTIPERELARLRYYQLYEQQMIFKSQLKERKEDKLKQLATFIKKVL